ncbi:PREDICTED: neuropeptides capa receptor-like [Dufourea novaeangliae]|uniref:Neuropeptides capa receptor n=1 Tax=Dufourea novaeangliae TaxID=178035 RepID=A0A154NXN6_DUFNO|nr:PREDICTED: neuropeptides capa receptor-like [Dufourea novaeangliae]KZC04373.1 Neuropeptides capa receptor [Dufourea novaeangliae]
METSPEDVSDLHDFWKDWDLKNLTESEYLTKVLGPKYLPMRMVVPLTIAYLVIFVTGIFGNVATCTVIIRNPSMQTATNYYLFSLAISDLTLLILGLPNELSVFWQQYPWALGVGLCKIRAYVSEMSSYVSVLTIVAFSMERYLAICHPLRVYKISGLKRPIRFILAAWSIALVCAIPFAIYTKVNLVEYPPESGNYSANSAICAMLLPYMPKFPLYELSSIIFFLIPMLVILVVYTRMGWKIRNSTRDVVVRGAIHGDSRRVQSRRSVIRMLSAVVIMFFVCWAPFHAQRLLYVYAQESDYYPDLNEWLYILSGCLYYFSTTVNPILYNLMSMKYRHAFKQTLCCVGRKPPSRSWTTRRTPQMCENGTNGKAHNSSFKNSVRYTIGQAKEMFRFTASRETVNRDENANDNASRKSYALKKEDSTSKPLLDRMHSVAREQASNKSAPSKRTVEESMSTASSIL